jgi:multicomponent Na+:H+ antiporter subunit E
VRNLRLLLLFSLLMAFWLLLSGRFDLHLVASGAVASAVIALASAPLLERTIGPAATHPRVRVLPAIPLLAWVLWRMILSALQLARIVLDPRLPPEPGIVRFRTDLTSPAARAVLSTSITLVPGTMTLEIEDDVLTIHTFTPDAVVDFASSELQNRIAKVFGDGQQPRPELLWESGHTLHGEVVPDDGTVLREGPFDQAELEAYIERGNAEREERT